jgi:hypothetical protein
MGASTAALFSLVSLSFLADFSLILLFLLLPELRDGPGQLIFIQSQAQILLDLHWFTSDSIWPHKDATTCAIIASVNNFGLALAPAYAAAICIAANSHFERQKYPSLWKYHIVVIAISAAVSLVIYFTDGAGKSTFGTCSLKAGSWAE